MKKTSLMVTLFIFITMSIFSNEININQKSYYLEGIKDQKIKTISDGKILELGYDSIKGVFCKIDYYKLGLVVTYCNLGKTFVLKEEEIKSDEIIATVGMTGYTLNYGTTIIIEIKNNVFLFGYNEN